ncbi:hypothetical protein QUB19_25455 [Microcoleus sp. B4-C5]|uniref:hypothetical protein n=1 Tax=unclassified Microcoleus TaxID=2642155 RepID=UPI002FD083CB
MFAIIVLDRLSQSLSLVVYIQVNIPLGMMRVTNNLSGACGAPYQLAITNYSNPRISCKNI